MNLITSVILFSVEKNSMSNQLYRKTAQLMIGATNSTNFFIYCASSSVFRKGLKSVMLRSKANKPNFRRSTNSQQSKKQSDAKW